MNAFHTPKIRTGKNSGDNPYLSCFRLLLLAVALSILPAAPAAPYLEEAFNYSAGQLGSPWGGTASRTVVDAGSLTPPSGLASPATPGNKLQLLPTGNTTTTRTFNGTAVGGGAVYISALLRAYGMPTSTGVAVLGLEDDGTVGTSSGGTVNAPLAVHVIQATASTYKIGVRKGVGSSSGGTGVVYGSDTFTTDDTVFVVAKYDFSVTPNTVTLWLNPDSSSYGASEASPSVTATNSGITANAAGLQYLFCRSWSAGNTNQLDDIRVGNSWADVTPSSGPPCTPPTINTQPTAQSDCAGEEVQFSVAATGTTLTYQWRKNGENLSNGGNISGATSATLTINPVGAGDAATAGAGYDCVVTESATCSTTSDRVALTVNTAPEISDQPENTSVAVGAEANFAVTATGAGLAYQWQVDTGSGFADVTDGSGADTASYTTVATTIGMNNYQYRCIVRGTCSPGATSDPATLTVTSCAAAGVTDDPENQSVTSPATATFSVTASGSDPTYQWEVSTDNGSNWNIVSGGEGADTASYTTPATTGAMNGHQYRCVVSVACDSSSFTSAAATLTVNCAPVSVTVDPVNSTVGLGSTATFTVTATGSPTLSYQWEVDAGSGFANVTDGSGANTASYTTAATTLGDDGNQYRCVVTSSCDGSTETSAAATLTVVDPATLQFRSAQTGNWGDAGTWEVFINSNWEAASAGPTSANDTITIRAGHVVTVAAAVTADQLTVESGGKVVVSGATLTIADGTAAVDMAVAGVLEIASVTSSVVVPTGTLQFESGGKFRWNSSVSSVSIPVAAWADGSECLIEGVTTVTGVGGLQDQSFYHFTWDCPAQNADISFVGRLTSVRGNLTIKPSSGTGTANRVRLNESGGSSLLMVGGDVVVGRGVLNLASSSGATGAALQIGGNFTVQSDGRLDVSALPSTGPVPITFSGAGPQTLTISGTLNNSTRYAWKVATGSTLALAGALTVNTTASFTVDGTLQINAGSVIGGTGTFTLNPGSTLAGAGTVNFATTVNGTVAPGASIGTLNFGSSLGLSAAAVAEMELGDAPAADKADATGAVTYAGTLRLIWTGTSLAASDTFDLFDGSGFSGAFTGLELVNWPSPALRVDTSSLGTDGTITVTTNAAPVAQDFSFGCTVGETVNFVLLGGKFAPGDADGDTLTITGVTPASSGTSGHAGGSLTYVANGSAGTHTFDYTIADPSGATDTGTVTVVVAAASNGANILPGSLSVNGQQIALQALGLPGATYRLQFADSLAQPVVWTDLTGSDLVAEPNGTLNFSHTAAESLPQSGFFRTKYVSGP